MQFRDSGKKTFLRKDKTIEDYSNLIIFKLNNVASNYLMNTKLISMTMLNV